RAVACPMPAPAAPVTSAIRPWNSYTRLPGADEELLEVVAHDGADLGWREARELRAGVRRGVGEPFAVREVGTEDDRLDADLGHDPLHVLLGERRHHEVVAEDLRRSAVETAGLREARLAAHQEG